MTLIRILTMSNRHPEEHTHLCILETFRKVIEMPSSRQHLPGVKRVLLHDELFIVAANGRYKLGQVLDTVSQTNSIPELEHAERPYQEAILDDSEFVAHHPKTLTQLPVVARKLDKAGRQPGL